MHRLGKLGETARRVQGVRSSCKLPSPSLVGKREKGVREGLRYVYECKPRSFLSIIMIIIIIVVVIKRRRMEVVDFLPPKIFRGSYLIDVVYCFKMNKVKILEEVVCVLNWMIKGKVRVLGWRAGFISSSLLFFFFFSRTQVGSSWTVEMSKRTLLYKRHHFLGISQPAFPKWI